MSMTNMTWKAKALSSSLFAVCAAIVFNLWLMDKAWTKADGRMKKFGLMLLYLVVFAGIAFGLLTLHEEKLLPEFAAPLAFP
jgi:lipoprotein signal peptidase